MNKPAATYQRIWQAVSAIPLGRVATYGQIAALAGLPRQARLVGYALHRLPADSPTPWHRVVNAQGRIALPPDSSAWQRQRDLLAAEGVVLQNRRIDLNRFGWRPAMDEQIGGSPDNDDANFSSTDSILVKLARLAANDPDIAVLWLYGSRAKGKATTDSDYDLAIAFVSFPDDPLKRQLRPELLAIDWAKVLLLDSAVLSIVDINLIPIPLAWEVINLGQVLYRDDSPRFYNEEQRIRSRMELDILYHRKHYE